MIAAPDPRIASALDEPRQLIAARYPTATFTVARGYDPEGVYLTATVDLDDTDEVTSVFIDRLLDMQIEDELPVYVIPVEAMERHSVWRCLPFAAAGMRP